MRETKGETQEVEECGGDERVREERSSRAAGKTVCVRPIFFFFWRARACVGDARHRRAQRREIEGGGGGGEERQRARVVVISFLVGWIRAGAYLPLIKI